jgi:hypothetical protein
MHKYLAFTVMLVSLGAYSQTPPSTVDDAHAQTDAPRPVPAFGQDTGGQTETVVPGSTSDSSNSSGTKMITNPPLGSLEEPEPMAFTGETERKNYVSGGIEFLSAYDSSIGTTSAGHSVSDNSYSVRPFLSWRHSTPRVHWNLAYAPGFTFYQHNSSLNQSDQSVNLGSEFGLSPHVTLTLEDRFVKTSYGFNYLLTQSDQSGSSPPVVSPGGTVPVISPASDQISNMGTVQIAYQFARNSMIGLTGSFSELRYLNLEQVSGLFNSNSEGAQAFYTHRIGRKHYIGATYEFQTLLTTPNDSHTETHTLTMVYTFYPKPRTSLSVFAGPQYSDTHGGGLPAAKNVYSSYGLSVGWQAAHTSFALTAKQAITAGIGLESAVRAQTAAGSIRHQLTKLWSGQLTAAYANNNVLAPSPQFNNSGHTLAGTLSLNRQIGEHLGLGISYARIHQSYVNVPALSATPSRNRVWLSLSYQFMRPIGR